MDKSFSNKFVDTSQNFKLVSQNTPKGDQPQAIKKLVDSIHQGVTRQVLLGVTGSGKTFTVANCIEQLNRPALILAHNKTLAAQLYSEFKDLFPENAVRYFVSYYDYYQPEAYLPSSDTYIEKDALINKEIDKLRHGATKALLDRRDVIVVSSVSCIYGLGDPQTYFDMMIYLEIGEVISREDFLKKLAFLQYQREDIEFVTATFRVRGDVVEVCPASESERVIRIEFFGDEIESLSEVDRLTGRVQRKLDRACIYPASHFVTSEAKVDAAIKSIKIELEERLEELKKEQKFFEAARLEQRTLYDLELINETGFCPGIENYTRHLNNSLPGVPPPTLIDYFPEDFLIFIDESHVTIPQIVGMYRGDRARKQVLVDFGFRLPSALDNRPLRFDEFDNKVNTVVYVSATPSEFEINDCKGQSFETNIVEQIIRPTGLIDPKIEIRPAQDQVDDFLNQLRIVVDRDERALVTTLTKKMAEHLAQYYREVGARVKYLHSEINTLERIDLIRGLREGEFDLLVGINLLREGLDLPEVSLVGIFDADKEGFLRSKTSLVQTIGRAARNLNGHVILYADKITKSIQAALEETDRRRKIQVDYNTKHNIIPYSVRRSKDALLVEQDELNGVLESLEELGLKEKFFSNVSSSSQKPNLPKSISECKSLIDKLKKEMFSFASNQEYEKAAIIRDKISILEKFLLSL